MKGFETPAEIEDNKELMERIEKIRSEAAVRFGLVERPEEAREQSPYNPFFAIVSSPVDYRCFNGAEVKRENVDIVSRLLFMLHMHKAYPITGTVCTGAAVRIPGSIPWEVMDAESRKRENLRIGHPAGVLEVYSRADNSNGQTDIKSIKVFRTARMIMDGTVYVS